MPAFPLSRWPAFIVLLAIGGSVSGCFRPMYGSPVVPDGSNVSDKMMATEVASVTASGGDRRLPRVAGVVRNELIFQLTGGGQPSTKEYRVVVSMSGGLSTVISSVSTGRASNQTYSANASYSLVEVATGKHLFSSTTFSRVSFEIPGQQYFAGVRALRDTEDRAAKVIAENIRSRLASYFYTGTP